MTHSEIAQQLDQLDSRMKHATTYDDVADAEDERCDLVTLCNCCVCRDKRAKDSEKPLPGP